MRIRRSYALASAAGTALFVTAGGAIAQEVVYDNTVTSTGFYAGGQILAGATTGYEYGDQITLGGAGRTATGFTVLFYNPGAANTGTAQIRFYNYPAGGGTNPGGSGALLWDSGQVAETFAGGVNTYTFTVPNVVVPNEFVWTATYTLNSAATVAPGPLIYNPPNPGTSGDFFWRNDTTGGTGWTQRYFGGNPVANFAAKVTAQSVVVNGACCRPDGTCGEMTNTACAAITGAVFQGTGTTCGATVCPAPGACCLAGGTCSFITQSYCLSQAGVYGGDGITCASANCPHQYFYDDGTAQTAVGFGGTPDMSLGFANQFTSVSGANTITHIQIVFGSPSTINPCR